MVAGTNQRVLRWSLGVMWAVRLAVMVPVIVLGVFLVLGIGWRSGVDINWASLLILLAFAGTLALLVRLMPL